ncbi:glycoside hydrolase [Plasmopara halstedii]|uniref:Glycoside hydrolase n=1 Tax=Plasmopara halstedii TaxID=4781 RepID=A0A0P1A6K1_PLAHL|nr:glycoside hydrolase [Plasmopara halstedii]CEG35802.1 glycoside hydrolase [Plasmopara halstedii]|eukprot:XP_024572171.1 glycoside hydrolase [Plasmopara halstedii]
MRVQPTNQEWTVNRRYSQFLQLRRDLQHKLAAHCASCANCASFNRAIMKFRFPSKSLIRTNSVVRYRVAALQDFLKLLVGRVYNDISKCGVCGLRTKDLMRPFLIRGAQPMNGSIISKINKSLSLESYAVVNQPVMPVPEPTPLISPSLLGRELFSASKSSSKPIFTHSQSKSIFSSSKGLMSSACRSTRSDDASTQPNESEDPIMDYSDSDDDGCLKRYDDVRCYDECIPLEEAMKQVVVPRGVSLTCEEVVVRLTSMWAAYDLNEALTSLPPERLSQQATFPIDEKEYAF